ncbi:MAG: pitrilysin family protein [Pseudomonadota bacterium]
MFCGRFLRYFFICYGIFLCNVNAYGSDARSDILQDPAIQQVIPSRDSDLFVVFKNGLSALIREDHASGVVACHVLVKAGSLNEGERTGGGLSHYLEHVVSGGTTSRHTEAEIKDLVREMGGASNAYTSYDQTAFYINTTKDHYLNAMSLLFEYVTDCRFNPSEYEREKPVILEEFQMGGNDPDQILWYLFMKTAYNVHPVRIPVIGERDVFMAMGRSDLMAHYKRWYSPSNIVVTVVGDVNKEKTLRTLLTLAGGLKSVSSPPYLLPDEPPQLAQRMVERISPIAKLTRVQMGFRTIRLTDPDLYPLDVLAVILGDGQTSELCRKVKEEKELVLGIDASSWTPDFVEGEFLISMTLDFPKMSAAMDAVEGVLQKVQKDGVEKKALERAKQKVVAGHIFSNQSAAGQARQISSDWAKTGDPYFSDKYVERIQLVTRDEIRRVAKKYLKEENLTVAVLRPSEASAKVIPDRGSGDNKGLSCKVVKTKLENGMTLLIKRIPAVPIVTLQYFVKGGQRYEPADLPGISNFMASLLTKGTKKRTREEIAAGLEDRGGGIGSGSGSNTIFVKASALANDFDKALEILADVLLNPTFPEVEIEKERKEILLEIKQLDEDWTEEIDRLFRKNYYVRHPYKNDILGTPKAVQGFSRDMIIEFYRTVVSPQNSVLAVYGDIDPEKIKEKVEAAFHGLASDSYSVEPKLGLEVENIFKDRMVTQKNQKTSCAIFLGFNGMALLDPDRPVVDVIDAIISGIGYPSGWLQDALRGDKESLVYYVHAYPVFGIDAGFFGAVAQTSVSNYETVLAKMKEQFQRIRSSEVDEVTLARAKGMCITMRDLSLETGAAQAASDAANELVGLGYDYNKKYPELIKKVRVSDVRRVAGRLFKHGLTVTTMPETSERK